MSVPKMVRGSARVVGGVLHADVQVSVPLGEVASPPPAAEAGPTAPAGPRPTHGIDFGSVTWEGETYVFSPTQREVVAALWRAWEEGHGYVMQESLLEVSDCECKRLRDLFRRHPAWGTLIVPAHGRGGPLGSYRLAFAD